LPKVEALTLDGVSVVSCGFKPLRLLSACQVVMLTPVPSAAVTAAVALPVMLESVAVMVVDPVATPVARPELFTVATAEFAADHVALEVTFAVLLSL
jgi:hypothetical protein